MRPCLCLIVLLATCAAPAHAGEPRLMFDGRHWYFPQLCAEWRWRRCWCPDDYCPKTLPCVPPNAKGCVDDYCPTKCPLFLGGLCEPWYTCGPPRGGPSRP